jgi:hypothetical protein
MVPDDASDPNLIQEDRSCWVIDDLCFTPHTTIDE